MENKDSNIYRASSSYILRNIAGQYVLVSVGAEIADFCGIVQLNKSAEVLWTLLQKGATKQEMVDELLNCFEIEEAIALDDVNKTIELLEERGMVSHG